MCVCVLGGCVVYVVYICVYYVGCYVCVGCYVYVLYVCVHACMCVSFFFDNLL